MDANEYELDYWVMPGAWVDKQGRLHIDVPGVIEVLHLPDNPEMRKIVAEELTKMLSSLKEKPLVVVRDHD